MKHETLSSGIYIYLPQHWSVRQAVIICHIKLVEKLDPSPPSTIISFCQCSNDGAI